MKRIFSVIISLIFIFIFFKACIKQDVNIESCTNKNISTKEDIIYPPKNKNAILNGIDYIQSQAPVGNFGGKIVLSIIGEGPKTFNPCNTKDATSASMAGLLYDGLFTTEAKSGAVIPLLAKSYKINGNDYIISLRKGIKWTDGNPITADDVIYTYNEVVFKGLGNPSTMYAMMIDGKLPELTKIDDYTIKFTTSKPFAPFLRQLTYPIVPKHYFKPHSDKGKSYFDAFMSTDINPQTIVSDGAFKLKEYVAAQRVVFERNPNYYKINLNNQKLPYIDKLVYLIVGDTNNEILKFEANEIDTLSLKGDNVARYKSKEKSSNYKIFNLGPDTGTLFIAINLNTGKDKNGKPYVDLKKQKWFGDKNFRNALDWAIDRKSMVQNVAFGVAEPLFTAESLNSIYLNTKLQKHDKNINNAKSALIESGFELKNNILYDSNGNRVEFDLYTNAGNLEREAIGVMIKQDFEELGMKVNFKPIEFNSLVNKLTKTFNWDMAIMGLTGSPLEPHDGKNVWASNGPLHLFNMCKASISSDHTYPNNIYPCNIYPWENELDELFEEGALKLTFYERKPIYDRYQEIIYEEKPIIYLYSPIRISAIRKKIKNVFPTSLNGLLYNLDEVYIDEEGK